MSEEQKQETPTRIVVHPASGPLQIAAALAQECAMQLGQAEAGRVALIEEAKSAHARADAAEERVVALTAETGRLGAELAGARAELEARRAATESDLRALQIARETIAEMRKARRGRSGR